MEMQLSEVRNDLSAARTEAVVARSEAAAAKAEAAAAKAEAAGARAEADEINVAEFVDRWCGEKLLPEARENLFAARALRAAMGQPSLGVRWDGYSKQLIHETVNFKSAIHAIRHAQTKIGFETRVNEEGGGEFMDWFIAKLHATYPNCADFISASGESPLSLLTDRAGVIRRNGKLLALQQIINVEVFCFLTTKLGAVPERVLEIGGGYGSSCRDWINMSGRHLKKYYVLDIPESLFYSEIYLRAHFGSSSVVHLAEKGAGAKFETSKIVLCPLSMIDRLVDEPIDVAINVGSMQEMPGEWLDYYERFLSVAGVRNFYSSNYLFQPLDCLLEGMNLCTPRLGSEWQILAQELMLATPEAQNRHVLRALFHKGELGDEAPALSEDIHVLENRPADKPVDRREGEALFRFIFAFRRGVPTSLSLRVVRALSTNFPYIPKELLYIVRGLLQNGEALVPSERQELELLRDRLLAMLPAGREDVT